MGEIGAATLSPPSAIVLEKELALQSAANNMERCTCVASSSYVNYIGDNKTTVNEIMKIWHSIITEFHHTILKKTVAVPSLDGFVSKQCIVG